MNKLLAEAINAKKPVVVEEPTLTIDEEVVGIEAYVQSCHDIDQLEQAMCTAQDSIGRTERLIAVLESMKDKGGLDPNSVALLNIAQDNALGAFGGAEAFGIETYGVESFNDPDSRITVTTFAVEALKDTIEAIWKTMMEFLKKVMDAVKMFFSRSSVMVKATKKRAETIKKEAGVVSGEMDATELDVADAANHFSIDGALSTDLPADLKVFASKVKSYSEGKDHVDVTKKLLETTRVFITTDFNITVDSTEEEVEATFGAAAKPMIDAQIALGESLKKRFEITEEVKDSKLDLAIRKSVSWAANTAKGGKGVTLFSGEGMLGNVQFVCELPIVDTEDFMFADSSSPTEMKVDLVTVAETSAKKAAALDKEQVASVCDGVIAICDALEAYDKEAKIIKELSDTAGEVITAAKDATAEQDNIVVRTVANLVIKALAKSVANVYQKPVVAIQRHAISNASAQLELCRLSLANYKAAE